MVKVVVGFIDDDVMEESGVGVFMWCYCFVEKYEAADGVEV